MIQNPISKREFSRADLPTELDNSQVTKPFRYDGENVTMDISSLNIMDASRVAVMCSTRHYIKNPKSKISLIVNSNDVARLIRPFNLGNIIIHNKNS